jgi:hypothetical protein
LATPVADISAVTLNFNILDIWTSRRDDGTVLYSGGTGVKSIVMRRGWRVWA